MMGPEPAVGMSNGGIRKSIEKVAKHDYSKCWETLPTEDKQNNLM